jgi:hypothetical protein
LTSRRSEKPLAIGEIRIANKSLRIADRWQAPIGFRHGQIGAKIINFMLGTGPAPPNLLYRVIEGGGHGRIGATLG